MILYYGFNFKKYMYTLKQVIQENWTEYRREVK